VVPLSSSRLLPRPSHATDPGRLGDARLRYEIDKGLASREPGSVPVFVADVANYTDIAPIVQISEIVGA
jgi:hypothetical protein